MSFKNTHLFFFTVSLIVDVPLEFSLSPIKYCSRAPSVLCDMNNSACQLTSLMHTKKKRNKNEKEKKETERQPSFKQISHLIPKQFCVKPGLYFMSFPLCERIALDPQKTSLSIFYFFN